MPKNCPLCGTEIVRPEGEVMHRCPNPKCESRGLETLINWVWDIDGVGEQAIRRLWREGIVTSLPDLYRLTKEQLMELDGYAEISAGNAIAGLNIPDTGWVTARNLAAHFGTIDALVDATQEEIQEVEGIGPGRAEAIAEWFSDDENVALVRELESLGLTMRAGDAERPVEGPLTGRQYVITGTLERYTREEAKAALEGLGAKVSDSVSKKTAGVIVGENPGTKVQKAQRAGVPILAEADLAELLSAG
jgi:DNA ligase (NAD+)